MFKWLKRLFKKNKKIEPERPVMITNDIPKVIDTPDIQKTPFRYFYPHAIYDKSIKKLYTPFKFNGIPKIFVIHFLAGNTAQSHKDTFNWFLKVDVCCLYMDVVGQVWQQHDLNRGGWHAGPSRFKNLKSLSKHAGGIEMASSGMLKKKGSKFYTWFDKEIPSKNVRYASASEGYVHSGYYEKFTDLQEESLLQFCLWLKANGVEHIVGHDEISPDRKNDVGGALSMPLQRWLKHHGVK